jgi:UDP-N-acetylglucosamine:LPS N-acetylglucosamine transferase
VPSLVRSLLHEPARRESMGRSMQAAARPEAAAEIAEELIALARA